ncbi:AIDA autotransporter-like protein ShdA [Salmonella enterica subsp. enterica serovar Kentucky]|nr:AIDA autotransporter-like protein ShdA [Salmonella enterica subsp. enterica serovar Kentucky]ECB6476909.1 autotransporter outer membrane beta-barrel domain-containing protein [Salmonella enterica subsp. enterica serovar Kentucky]ECB6866843.1 autotransporter outer membrane beta-barrel domain-containing protein [Salmonella enterica subsp. enterica serovar Kentucky]
MNKTYNIIWNAARGMYIVTSELARSGSRAIVSVSASCAVTLLAMDAAPAVAEETRVSIPSQTTTYTLSGATPFVVETGNTVATDIATSAAIVGDNSNDWDLLIESGAVVGSSLTDSQAMNLDSLTGATSVHNQGTITGSNEDGTILLQNGGSVINDGRIENSATYEHDPQDIPQEYAGVYMLNGGSYVSSESGVLEGVSGVIVQSGEAHITNGGMINSDGSWRSYGVEFRDGTYGTIVNTGTIITTASDGSGKIEDAAIYVHTLNDMAVSGSVSVDNSGLMQSDFITVALYHGSHFEVVNRVGGVITAGNSSLVGIKSTAMELKVGVDNLVTNDGTISAYGTANTYGIHYGESTSGGVITNTGSITTTGGGAGDASVYVHGNGDGTVVNNSGTMSSTVYGVYLDSARSKGHTLNNQAGSAISANTAVAINGNGNTITNQGKMTGVSDGLLISGNNNIVTTSGGEISGKNGIRVSKGSGNQITAKSGSKITATSTGISIASGNNQVTTESGSAIVAKDNGILINSGANNVTNGGSITATGSSNSYGIQYNSGASGTITNTGTITTTGKGVGDASVYAHGGAVTINNSGTMDSSVFGVYVTTGHTLNNLAGGSISANTAVQFHGNNNKLANAGAISGDTNGVTISGSGNTLTNQGKITGGTNAILINSGSKNNTLTLNTGTEISGSITDDNNSASANNNLILDGEGTLGSSISGLNSVTSSGDWTLSGATMNLSGTTNSALWVKSGTLILNGAMTAKGATVDSGTTLQIGNGGTLGAFNGDIVDNGTLTFNRSDAAAYGSVISGSGNVVKQGGGELTLSNNNSYSGGTTIAEGTLTATAGGALGSGNIDNRAYLKLDAASASDPFIVADLTTHSGATVEIGAGSTLQANTLTQQDGSTLTADLTATSGPAIRAKNVNLDGTLNVASPASQEPIRSTDDLISLALIESDNAISGDFDGITINGNAMNPDAFITVVGQKNVNDTHYDLVETLTWYADRYNAAIDAHGTFNLADADDSFTVNTVLENVDANSGWNGQSLTKTGAGTLILNAENTYTGGTLISDGTLVASNVEALGTGDITDNAVLELNTGGDFDNAISGSGQVVKSGDETLTLSGSNTYTGGTIISGGTLVATNVEALGTGDVTDNATLELNTGGDFDNAIGGTGSVVKSGDKTLTLSGATTISGGTLVASNVEALGSGDVTDNATLELNTGGDFANNIGGTGSVVKSGDKTLTLSGTNSYTGGTTISGGTLVANNVEALGTGDVTNNATLELNTGGDFDNAISGSGQVVKSGDKTLTLSGANSYSGATTISGGTLIATHVNALGTGAIDNRASLLLDASGQFTVTDLTTESGGNTEIGAGSTLQATTLTQKSDSTLTINLNGNTVDPVIHAASQVSLAGTLDITGVGDVLDSDPASTDDLDTFTLIASDKTIAGDFEKLTVAGMDADLADFITVDGRIDDTGKQYELTTALTWYADRDDAVTDAHGTFNLTNADGSFAVNTVLENVDATLDPASATGWDGTSLIKQGAGTLILNAENTYTGGTTISGGTLVATNVDALGSGDVTDDATLELNTGGTFDNAIGGSGNVVKSGADTLTLSGSNSYTGGTTISGGTLVASNVEALGTGDVTNNATLELNTGGDFINNIGGTGRVEKSGDDTLTLSGSNTYTGGTLINGGTLVASNVEALGTGDVTDNATLALNTGGTFDNAISGSGQVVKSGDETLTLSGTNSYTGGTTISGGTLVATNVEALGSGDVTDDATLELNTGGTFDNAISGSGQVVKSGDKMLTLSGANSYSGGTLISDGTLVASNVEALGTGDVTNNATLALNTGGDFTNNISGSGQVVKSGDDTLTLSGANSYTGGTTISGGTLVATNVDALGTGDVTNSSTLELNTGGTFDNAISGSGQVVKSGDETLTLSGSNTYTGGTLISGGTLVATNVDALGTGDVTDNATLELNTGGTFDNVISGSGQVVKSGDDTLTLSGANSYTGGTLISGGTLVATSVEALGSGDVTDNAVLELNTGGTFDNAISGSGQVVKSGDKTLTLSGANSYTGGTTISGGTLVASNVEALGSGDIDNYASLQLNASGQFVTANLTTHDNAITAIGAGSALRANTLTQEANSTLAVHLTDSNSGAIVTADRANLGGTLDITGIGNVAKSWTRDAYAYTLIDSDSAIDSDFAQFTVAGMDAKQVDFLTVDGRVNADDDTRYDVTASLSWYADSDNAATDAHGTFTLSEQGHSFTLNTALTDVDATLNPDSATYWDGKSLIKRGAGTLILGAQNTYSGDTDVQEGALWLAETATIGSAGSAQAVNIAANAAFGGHNATVNGHVNNLGNLYFVDTFTVNGDVVNSSAMISGSDQPNNTLTIAGNYTGNDGHLYLNTQLGDDSSPTDKLIVTGDTAGSTTLHITNVNGLGAQTVNGIEVIEVGGQSDGDFRLYKGHVDINAWTYTLKQDGGDWYLRSESDDVPDDGGEVTPPDDGGEVTPPDDGGEVTPPDDGGEVTPPDDGGEVTPPDDDGEVTPPDDGGDITPPDDGGDITPPDGGDVTPVAPQYRADIGVYLGNQWMARNLQMQTLYDREGSQYRSADGSIWMRFKAGKAESQAVNGNVDIDSDYSQFQLGGDILTWSDGAQSVTVGLMGSYINASTDSTGNRGADGSQFSANGSVDGYNLGLYATWFADAQSHRGAYIDSWYQYGAYNNSVDNDGLSASRYDSAAHAVSLETGYRYDIALSNRNTVSLTPQAQVTWQRYSADTVIDDGGTRISGQNDDSWTTRLGMRVDGKLYKESGRIQPFMEVNWLHASDNASATFGDTKVSQDLPNDRVEVKVGIQANVSERLSVYAQAAGQKGKNDYGDASFSLNMRYNW